MPENALATQASLEHVNYSVQQASENMAAHLNASLSEAHGIDTFPGVNPDEFGNDLSHFWDSENDIVGDVHVRITISGTPYWIPAVVTDLPGYPSTRGIADINYAQYGVPTAQGGSSLVTAFALDVVQYIQQVMTDYLTPHTRKGYWETHGNIDTIEPKVTDDSAGHHVGDTWIKVPIDGVVYNVIAHTRFSGPPIVIRGGSVSPSKISVKANENDGDTDSSDQKGTFTFTLPYQGTKPITYNWQVSANNVDWSTLNMGTTYRFAGNCISPGDSNKFVPSATKLVCTSTNAGENWQRQFYVRMKMTNAAGTFYSNTAEFWAHDEDDCWICKKTHRIHPLKPSDWRLIFKFRRDSYKKHGSVVRFYKMYGNRLLERMDAAGVNWTEHVGFQQSILTLLRNGHTDAAYVLYRDYTVAAVQQYWPECPHKGYKDALAEQATKTTLRLQ